MKIPVLLYVEEFKVRFNMLRTHILISSQNLKFENSPMQYTQFGEKKCLGQLSIVLYKYMSGEYITDFAVTILFYIFIADFS